MSTSTFPALPPLRLFVGVVMLALVLAGCVVIPYRPSSETKHDLSQVPNPERLRLTVGPRRFLEKMTEDVLAQDERLQQVDGQTFIDAASPGDELTLARLLDASTSALIEPLNVDYLVVFGQPEDATLDSWGGVVPYVGFYGLSKSKSSTTSWAAVIDLRQLQLVEQVTTKSVGTDAGVGLFYGLFLMSDTQGSAKRGVIRNVARTIASARPTGPVRVVFLASEQIRSAQEIAAEQRAMEGLDDPWARGTICMMGACAPSSLDGYPSFESASPPSDGESLIYLYRPENVTGSFMPLGIGARIDERNVTVTQLLNGGYFPFRVRAGAMSLSAEAEPAQSVMLDAKPGETYYVRASMSMGWKMPHQHLVAVDSDKGEKDIRKCKRVPSAKEALQQTRKLADVGFAVKQMELAQLYATGVEFPDGESLPRDDVESYKWFSIASQSGDTTARTLATKQREAVTARMSAEQIAEGERRARTWIDAYRKEHPASAPPATDASG